MKIGIVSEYYYPTLGGIQEHVHHFALEAMAQGHAVTVITPRILDVPEDRTDTDQVPTIRLGLGIPLYQNSGICRVTLAPFLGRRLQEIFERERFDVIHIQAPLTPVLPLLAVTRSKTVTVGTLHTNFKWSPFLWLFNRACRRYLARLDGLIAVSKTAVAALHQHFDTECRVIPNGIDTTQFRPDVPKVPQFDDGLFNLLWVGRMEPRSTLDRMIQAFVLASATRQDLRLIVIGDGPLRPAYEKIVPTLLKRRVTFTGFVNEGRPALYASADVLCVPSTISSFGITLLEGMAAAKPIIASDIDGFRDVMADGREGMLIDTGNPIQFRDAILKLASDRALAAGYGRRGRETAESYSWPRVTGQILDYYLEAAERRRTKLRAGS